jgi:hypothetical protein
MAAPEMRLTGLRRSNMGLYWCAYDIAWRADVDLTGREEMVKRALESIAVGIECLPLRIDVGKDYVHVRVLCPVTFSPLKIVMMLKRETASIAGPSTWKSGYVIVTYGQADIERLLKLI